MRGKDVGRHAFHVIAGITPAYAGKSFSYSRMPPRIGDHPRVCGEKRSMLEQMGYNTGSPPRMRGKVHDPYPTAL